VLVGICRFTKDLHLVVEVPQAPQEARFSREHIYILIMTICKRSLRSHEYSLSHHIKPMMSLEINRFPHKINSYNMICYRWNLHPNWLTAWSEPRCQGVPYNLRKVATINTVGLTVGTQGVACVESRSGSLLLLLHFKPLITTLFAWGWWVSIFVVCEWFFRSHTSLL